MEYTLEDLKNAFESGSHFKEKYLKLVDDSIQVSDFDKFINEYNSKKRIDSLKKQKN